LANDTKAGLSHSQLVMVNATVLWLGVVGVWADARRSQSHRVA